MKTIALSVENHAVLNHWRKFYGLKTFDELISRWRKEIRRRKIREFYLSLEEPMKIVKPLISKKIRKIYKK
jgi:hypothetical protein